MAFPTQGLIKIYPHDVTIISGDWSLNSDVPPQPVRTPAVLDAYYDARVTNLAVAPCLRRATEIPLASGVYVPAVGTHELQFSPSSIGIEFYDVSYPSPVVATLDFLDADFPMGMMLTEAQIGWTGSTLFGATRDRDITNLIFKYFGATISTYTPPGGISMLLGRFSGTTSIMPNLFTRWGFVNIMKPFGISIPVAAAISVLTSLPASVTSECFILAVYNTQFLQITTTTPDTLPGSDTNISSNTGSLSNLDIDEFKIYWDTLPGEEDVNPLFPGWTGGVRIPRYLIWEFTDSLLRFRMPTDLGIPYGGRRLMLTGTGNNTFFVGEVALQNYNITLVEGSGLYKLTNNKRNDTYYDRGVTPVETVDLKIPDPYAKTGGFNA